MILPKTANDSEPSSTVVLCLREDPTAPLLIPLARPPVPRRREVVEPAASLEDTREDVDARADRCCEVMYGLPRADTLRGRGDMGRLSDPNCCGFAWPSRSSHMVVAVNGMSRMVGYRSNWYCT